MGARSTAAHDPHWDDVGRIADRPAVQEQDGQRAAPCRAPSADQVVGAEHLTVVRDALVVERPADLLAIANGMKGVLNDQGRTVKDGHRRSLGGARVDG